MHQRYYIVPIIPFLAQGPRIVKVLCGFRDGCALRKFCFKNHRINQIGVIHDLSGIVAQLIQSSLMDWGL